MVKTTQKHAGRIKTVTVAVERAAGEVVEITAHVTEDGKLAVALLGLSMQQYEEKGILSIENKAYGFVIFIAKTKHVIPNRKKLYKRSMSLVQFWRILSIFAVNSKFDTMKYSINKTEILITLIMNRTTFSHALKCST